MEENLPEFLYHTLVKEYGVKQTNQIIEGYKQKRVTTLRVNTTKTEVEKVKEYLRKQNIKFQEVNWYKEALIIEELQEKELAKLEIYEKGEIYLQSLSSMVPPLVVALKKGETILDMAAAPGGKTTQMANLSNNEAMITACEKNKIRAERLKYNLQKQGATRVNVMVEDARKLDDFFSFDKILLDAPCSGSGTIGLKQEQVKKDFTQELVNRSIKTQKELLKKAINLVKEQGEIIYSTCSILKEENEWVLKEILETNKVKLVPIQEEKFVSLPQLPVEIKGSLCIAPNELYEGFFVAKMKKVKK